MKKAPVGALFGSLLLYASFGLPRVVAQDGTPSGKSAVRFEGLRKVSESDLLKALDEHGAAITKEEAGDPARLQTIAGVIKQYLAAHGYLNASAAPAEDPSRSAGGVVTFVVDEGERPRIAEIDFEGNRLFPRQELLDLMRRAQGDAGPACVPPGEYDPYAFDSCLRAAAFVLRSKGYLKAKLGEPRRQETELGLKLTVPVLEGRLYRLGEMRLEGATVFTPEQALGMLNLKKGDLADAVAIKKWLDETLKRAYADRGYIRYFYEVEPDYRPLGGSKDEGVVNLLFTIDEGISYKVRSIKLEGCEQVTGRELSRLFLLGEGDTYNEQLLRDGIAGLNKLGLFEPVDADRDTVYRLSEDKASLDITIKLKERAR